DRPTVTHLMSSKSKQSRDHKSAITKRRPTQGRRRSCLEMLEQRRMMATLATNLPDYVPGEMAHIYASSFQPGEAVQFQVLHNDGTPNTGGGHLPWSVVDGS